jgi:branched-chain amino acid transport system substrate-binding protein
MVGYENDYVGILRAARVLKPPVKAMIGVWSLATPKMATDFPDLMPNVYGTALLPFPATFTTADGKTFADTYKTCTRRSRITWASSVTCNRCCCSKPLPARPTKAR